MTGPKSPIAELFIGSINDDDPGVLFSVVADPTRGVFLTDREARALRDWLIAKYGQPEVRRD